MYTTLQNFRAPGVANPWGERAELDCSDRAPLERLARLRRHLDCEADFLLVGEAAGYQGCRYSGIAFTSERLLLAGQIPRVPCPLRLTRRARPWSEPSASILWRTLHALGIAGRVVLWNAFPWHPHRPGNPHSNRRPTRAELTLGATVLQTVLKRFDQALPIAVGQVAHQSLETLLGDGVPRLRHPAYGGAGEFAQGLARLLRTRRTRG